MDKEVREKVHFVTIRDLDEPKPGQVYCNCGHKWPCPILRVYEDAENVKAGLIPPRKPCTFHEADGCQGSCAGRYCYANDGHLVEEGPTE